jgi:nicotinamidase-related amidase
MLVSSIESTRTFFGRARPWLVCVDLQREYVVPGRPLYEASSAPVAQACRRVLEHARTRRWRVIHTQQRHDEGLFARSGYFGAPIEGLRPLISEPVFVRTGLSAFSNPDFAAEMGDALGEDVYLIGFSLNHTCLATAFAAVDMGLSVTVVEDAMGVAPCPGMPSGRASEIAEAILAPFVRFACSDELTETAEAMEALR